jgi:hypothetical protein
MLACVASALAEGLSLPGSWSYSPASSQHAFRPEWLVVATLVVVFVHRAARACWWCAGPAVVLPTLQLAYAVEAGVERLAGSGVAADVAGLWWALVAVQLAVFLGAAVSGAVGSIRDRRWEKFLLRRLGPEDEHITRSFHLAT